MRCSYVLTTVLPRYTMSGAHRASFAAGALEPVPDAVKRVYFKHLRAVPEPEGDDARVMGHDPK